jgi:hypothetical protein
MGSNKQKISTWNFNQLRRIRLRLSVRKNKRQDGTYHNRIITNQEAVVYEGSNMGLALLHKPGHVTATWVGHRGNLISKVRK